MTFNKTINKYIVQELLGPFLLGLLIFTFVLLMEKVLDLIELVINKGVSLPSVLQLITYIMPSFLVLTIPMAVLVATLTAFGRLSTDSEVTAMKASGISLYTLFVPVLLFAIVAMLLTYFLYARALPWGNHNFRVKLYELARTKASVGLKEHVFNTTFRNLVIYIDQIVEGDNTFRGVMISDSRDEQNPQSIFARKGELITDEQALRVTLRLYDGASHPKNVVNPLKYQIVEFPVLDILLSLEDEEGQTGISIPRTDRDMSPLQLVEQYVLSEQRENPQGPPPVRLPNLRTSWLTNLLRYPQVVLTLLGDSFSIRGRLASPYLVEIHKRFSIPFACIVFGLIATPLGIQSRRAGKSGGFAISVVLLLVYYIFITAGESLGDDGKLPVFWAVWTPNILLGITGIFLLIRIARR
ncbi:LPS export ABC transporter permease LptF [candidate division KSB3 bacterium]|uniref:LPS export ABC transporter permease LptF n=1 Tax=candidate division KSB3 bacterium TaxID=2044937 RepID=A0A9D5JXS2_9BACT|nr:LPS export ABC transporter permease LptF [candidate division KSB3 bacterium]MBD3326119.1 LPS export ABC transporter permease LptF [candidate division KSB3 bacterium]